MDAKRVMIVRETNRTTATDERAAHFVKRLEHLSGRDLVVRIHRNRWTYFSCRTQRGSHRVYLRMHEAFFDAPVGVVRAVATLIGRNDTRARRVLRSWIEVQSRVWDKRSDRPPRPPRIVTRGAVYDLRAIFNDLNRRYFEGSCAARITWGNGTRSARGQRQITFGTYDKTTNIIRIHPALDHRRVPDYFIRYITFHEMLHATTPAPLSPNGRRLFHSRLFRQRERMFEDFERAQAWGKHFIEDVI